MFIKLDYFLLNNKYYISKSIDSENVFLLTSEKEHYVITYIEVKSNQHMQSRDYCTDYVALYLIDKDIFCWFNPETNKYSSGINETDYDNFDFLLEYNRVHLRKVERPSKEELGDLLWKESTVAIAKKYGVSDKTIEKWTKIYNLNKPTRGYWVKLKYNKV